MMFYFFAIITGLFVVFNPGINLKQIIVIMFLFIICTIAKNKDIEPEEEETTIQHSGGSTLIPFEDVDNVENPSSGFKTYDKIGFKIE